MLCIQKGFWHKIYSPIYRLVCSIYITSRYTYLAVLLLISSKVAAGFFLFQFVRLSYQLGGVAFHTISQPPLMLLPAQSVLLFRSQTFEPRRFLMALFYKAKYGCGKIAFYCMLNTVRIFVCFIGLFVVLKWAQISLPPAAFGHESTRISISQVDF